MMEVWSISKDSAKQRQNDSLKQIDEEKIEKNDCLIFMAIPEPSLSVFLVMMYCTFSQLH